MLAESTNTIIGLPFIKLNLVDSTNNYAMQQVKNGVAKHGTVYFASEQTAGKGQRTKQWLSNRNENIIFSIVIEPKGISISQQFYLNVIAALSAVTLFNKYTTNYIKIKWPNDIYWRDRKTGGILIENLISGNNFKFAVIGFGLNINQTTFSETLKNPASLKQITAEDYNVIMLAEELCLIFQNMYAQLLNGATAALMYEYNDHLYKRNTMVKFKKASRVFDALIKRVDEAGKLIAQTEFDEAFEFGSVEWVIE